MDSTPVNWDTLDSLIINFAKSENLLEDCTESSSPSSSGYHSRLVIRQIRKLIEIGDIDSSINLLRIHAPFVLDDHRLLFRLQKQKFIELLRRGTTKDRDAAIDCIRTVLAPCALDAYPEAYEEFKHVLLALIFDKDDQTSPVANELVLDSHIRICVTNLDGAFYSNINRDKYKSKLFSFQWSEKRRFDIAGLLSSVLRVHLQAFDPIFSMTLRYLISIHNGFCFRQGIPSPVSDLTERLLIEERDPAPTPQESLLEAPPFDEVDVQALAHAVDLTRQGAIDSLRSAKGDLFQAFKNELCRMRMDVSVLDDLVHEYCVYRGIVECGLSSGHDMQSLGRSSVTCEPDPSNGSSLDCSINMDVQPCKDSDGETSVCNPDSIGTQEMNVRGVDVERRVAYETESNREDCSTSSPENFKNFQKNRGHGTGERSGRKRWRGRNEGLEVSPDISLTGTSKQKLSDRDHAADIFMSNEKQVSVKRPASENFHIREEYKYDIVLEMKELASKGMTVEVVKEINALDPNFFVHNPDLLFQLKQVEFLKLVSSGDRDEAIKVAKAFLGPSTASNATLLKPLKETLFLALMGPNEDPLTKGVPLSLLATSLQVALGRRLGIEEPQLMKIVRTTIHSHNEWFKIQMCKDRFEGLLKIDCLKDINTSLLTESKSNINLDADTSGSSQVTVSSRMLEDSSSPSQVSPGDVVCDESAILKVMEFLALPRADAIHLLAEYNGNAETVIQQIFA
ncbi:uncharacterized protein LOC113346630 isoform X2 [Papaver somniferum]|uniref:uncharacterized protein LOC113346630 isoform X2 n=1 Tax=Papaver somniferum TaxID=3469 RepID=UPI000E6F8EA2|nr:uncharacterized protein LOC113346630 isoform X2 [Papaver somniferum]